MKALASLVIGLAALAGLAFAADPDEVLSDPALEARARALDAQLRCVVCQSQSIAESDAPLAKDMRLVVRERLLAGDTDGQVRDYLVARYGDYVLLKPPVQTNTLVLWLFPAGMIVVAGGLAFAYLRRMKMVEPAAPLSAEEERALQAAFAKREENAADASASSSDERS